MITNVALPCTNMLCAVYSMNMGPNNSVLLPLGLTASNVYDVIGERDAGASSDRLDIGGNAAMRWQSYVWHSRGSLVCRPYGHLGE